MTDCKLSAGDLEVLEYIAKKRKFPKGVTGLTFTSHIAEAVSLYFKEAREKGCEINDELKRAVADRIRQIFKTAGLDIEHEQVAYMPGLSRDVVDILEMLVPVVVEISAPDVVTEPHLESTSRRTEELARTTCELTAGDDDVIEYARRARALREEAAESAFPYIVAAVGKYLDEAKRRGCPMGLELRRAVVDKMLYLLSIYGVYPPRLSGESQLKEVASRQGLSKDVLDVLEMLSSAMPAVERQAAGNARPRSCKPRAGDGDVVEYAKKARELRHGVSKLTFLSHMTVAVRKYLDEARVLGCVADSKVKGAIADRITHLLSTYGVRVPYLSDEDLRGIPHDVADVLKIVVANALEARWRTLSKGDRQDSSEEQACLLSEGDYDVLEYIVKKKRGLPVSYHAFVSHMTSAIRAYYNEARRHGCDRIDLPYLIAERIRKLFAENGLDIEEEGAFELHGTDPEVVKVLSILGVVKRIPRKKKKQYKQRPKRIGRRAVANLVLLVTGLFFFFFVLPAVPKIVGLLFNDTAVSRNGFTIHVNATHVTVEYVGKWAPFVIVNGKTYDAFYADYARVEGGKTVASYSLTLFPQTSFEVTVGNRQGAGISCYVVKDRDRVQLRDCTGASVEFTDVSLDEAAIYYVPEYVMHFVKRWPRTSGADAVWYLLKWLDENAHYDDAKTNNPYIGVMDPLQFFVKSTGVCSDYAVFSATVLLASGFDHVYVLRFDTERGGHAVATVEIGGALYVVDQHLPPWEWDDYVARVFKPVSDIGVAKIYRDGTVEFWHEPLDEFSQKWRDTWPQDQLPPQAAAEAVSEAARRVGLQISPVCQARWIWTLKLRGSIYDAYSPAFHKHFVEQLTEELVEPMSKYGSTCVSYSYQNGELTLRLG